MLELLYSGFWNIGLRKMTQISVFFSIYVSIFSLDYLFINPLFMGYFHDVITHLLTGQM